MNTVALETLRAARQNLCEGIRGVIDLEIERKRHEEQAAECEQLIQEKLDRIADLDRAIRKLSKESA